MLVPANLTPEEFRNVHNALCDLNQIAQKLAPVAGDMAGEMNQAIQTIREQFAGAYRAEDELFETRNDHYHNWGHRNHLRDSIWSMYEVADLDSDSHLLAPDQPKLIVYRSHWGKNPSVTRIDPEVTNWGYLWIVAEALIRASGDRHHVYVEGFHVTEWLGEPALELITGS